VARAKSTHVKIVVDVHERQSGIAETLAELGAEIEIASLPAGDYAVGAETLVERKRVLDLHAAVLKGRLWPQLCKLRAVCAFPYLLLEGSDIDRGPLHHNAVRGVCLAVIDQGIALLRSGYQRDSALWIHRLAVRCQEVEPAPERPAYAQRPRPKPGEATAEALLSSVPGISSSCARALLARFGSVAGVVAASPAEWLEVPGNRTGARTRARRNLSPRTQEHASRRRPLSRKLRKNVRPLCLDQCGGNCHWSSSLRMRRNETRPSSSADPQAGRSPRTLKP
jgi:DNA excision repair protein ERCC-4